jgi:hypothetical protein
MRYEYYLKIIIHFNNFHLFQNHVSVNISHKKDAAQTDMGFIFSDLVRLKLS